MILPRNDGKPDQAHYRRIYVVGSSVLFFLFFENGKTILHSVDWLDGHEPLKPIEIAACMLLPQKGAQVLAELSRRQISSRVHSDLSHWGIGMAVVCDPEQTIRRYFTVSTNHLPKSLRTDAVTLCCACHYLKHILFFFLFCFFALFCFVFQK